MMMTLQAARTAMLELIFLIRNSTLTKISRNIQTYSITLPLLKPKVKLQALQELLYIIQLQTTQPLKFQIMLRLPQITAAYFSML